MKHFKAMDTASSLDMSELLGVAAIYFFKVAGALSKISGDGKTTRYWDCCKPSCSSKENIGPDTIGPVAACGIDGFTRLKDLSARSGCEDDRTGIAYSCYNLQPWAVNSSLAYGFVATSFQGGVDNTKCCTCFKLTFGGTLSGKTMIVQNVNTGSYLEANHFGIQVPGGGVGIIPTGCHLQWNAPYPNGWGKPFGGIDSDSECSGLPAALQPGCQWRFNWFQNADNPPMHFEQIDCPSQLLSKSQCLNNN